jgi:periplasmic protein TonB
MDWGEKGEPGLFQDLVATSPRAGGWFGVRESVAAHALLLGAAILLPILWPPELPATVDFAGVLYLDPPPAAAAPLLRGRPDAKPKATAVPVTPEAHPRDPAFTEPQTSRDDPIEPEARPPENEQLGSETGSDAGIPEGMEGGQEGGDPGGIPGGVPGGCVGCAGEGPVRDYDQPPRLLRSVSPQYPQEAFVKKIEGTVVLEILIDSTGRVAWARVVTSIPALDGAAIATVKQWLFEPAVKRGRHVATLARAPVAFRIL